MNIFKSKFVVLALALVSFFSCEKNEVSQEIEELQEIESVNTSKFSLHPDTFKTLYPVRLSFVVLPEDGVGSGYLLANESIVDFDLRLVEAENLASGFTYVSNADSLTKQYPTSDKDVYFVLPEGIYDFSKYLPYQSGRYFTAIVDNETLISKEVTNDDGFVDVTVYVYTE